MVAQLDKTYITTRPARALVRAVSYGLFEGRPLTTRGRWLNPWLKKRARAVAEGPASAPPDRPLFIFGTGRSGTTVLGKILSMHREVGWLNEPKLMWHVALPNEDLNGNYTGTPARYRLTAEDASAQVKQAMNNQYAAYLQTTRNSRVLDKYPELIFRAAFIKELFPDARFLLLIRNGYATCSSIARWSATHGKTTNAHSVDWWGSNDRKWHLLVEQIVRQDSELGSYADSIKAMGDQTARAAVEWILTMQEGLRLLSEYPDATLTVRYEKLTGHPGTCVADILEFCELQRDPAVVEYAEKILQPPTARPAFELPESIQGAFERTLQRLNYAD